MEEALQQVLSVMRYYVDPAATKLRQRQAKPETRAAGQLIIKQFHRVWPLLSEPRTLRQLMDESEMPDTPDGERALWWITRTLCAEVAESNEEVGHRTRGFWQLKPDWR